MSINQIDKHIPLIVEELKSIQPHKIILFGSYAYGEPTMESDIDLLVVTDSNYFPQNYKEKSDIHLEVAKRLRNVKKQVAIDLIVQTKSMHNKFVELNSMFAKEILQRGKVLYERNHPSMAG